MLTTRTPKGAIILILDAAPEGTTFSVSDAMADYEFDACYLSNVPVHHRDTDRGGPLHHSFTCMQEVVGAGERRLGQMYTVLDLEGKPLIVYYSII